MKSLILLATLLGFSAEVSAQTTPLYPALSRTIDSLYTVDQRPMQVMMQGQLPDSITRRLIAEQHITFTRHQPILESIVKRYGYPGFKEVGEKSSNNFSTLIQHADAHPEFQRRMLQLMLLQVKVQNVSPRNYAYLTDRLAEATGQPQEYGTQVTYKGPGIGKAQPRSLRDPKNVNNRRAAIGMETLEEYLRKNDELHQQMSKPQHKAQ